MKRILLRSLAFLLVLSAAMLIFSSCRSINAEKKLEYVKSAFCAKIRGRVDENEVIATLYSNPDAQNDGVRATLVFSHPKGLQGVTVTLCANGEYGVRVGESSVRADWAEGLLKPYFPIFSVGGVYSAQLLDDGTQKIRVCDENCDLIYVFDKDSNAPRNIQGVYFSKNIDFVIEDFSFNYDFQK